MCACRRRGHSLLTVLEQGPGSAAHPKVLLPVDLTNRLEGRHEHHKCYSSSQARADILQNDLLGATHVGNVLLGDVLLSKG